MKFDRDIRNSITNKFLRGVWVQRWPILLLIVVPIIAGTTFYLIDSYLEPDKLTNAKEISLVKKDVLQITAQILVGISVISGAYFTWKRLEVSREDQITDRYTRAIDQLGSDRLEIRLGGIYALERLAKDSPKDQITVLEVLTAFIRENASLLKFRPTREEIDTTLDQENSFVVRNAVTTEVTVLNTDIKAILTIIGSRTWSIREEADLSQTHLIEAQLQGAQLQGANLQRAQLVRAQLVRAQLQGAKLQGANLERSHLERAQLQGPNLQEASLRGAHLEEANLQRANLQEANLERVQLQGANLQEASLRGAHLKEANLQNADLWGAKLQGAIGICPIQIQSAINWETASYDESFRSTLDSETSPAPSSQESN